MVFFVSIDMDVVGVMAAYLPLVPVCTAQSIIIKYFKYFIIILIVSTNYIFVDLFGNKVF